MVEIIKLRKQRESVKAKLTKLNARVEQVAEQQVSREETQVHCKARGNSKGIREHTAQD